MSELPLPPALRPFLDLAGPVSAASRSLLFDRAFDRYDPAWTRKIPTGGQQAFLETFRRFHSRAPADFGPFLTRRTQALEATGARSSTLYAQTRLVVGLGLPHPTETALLFDRVTGSPYVPGSSLKGVLRSAARLVALGESDTGDAGDRSFWAENLDRTFGPELGGEATPAKGELLFHDAFPERWPELELDVLTPHYGDYYSDPGDEPAQPPADWLDPNPVSFLTVAAGTGFTFWLGHRAATRAESDLPIAERLLHLALGALGLGGKTSSGYGVFASTRPAVSRPIEPVAPEHEDLFGAAPPDPDQVRWNGADLYLLRNRPTARGPGGELAQGLADDLEPGLFDQLRQGVILRADVRVKQRNGRWSLLQVVRVVE